MYIKSFNDHISTFISKTKMPREDVEKILDQIYTNLKDQNYKNVDMVFKGLKLDIDRRNPEDILYKLSTKWNGFKNYRKFNISFLLAGKANGAFFAYMMEHYYDDVEFEDNAYISKKTLSEIEQELSDYHEFEEKN